MKCVCGYTTEDEEGRENPKAEPFAPIQGSFSEIRELRYGGEGAFPVMLKACPKCDTIKVVRW